VNLRTYNGPEESVTNMIGGYMQKNTWWLARKLSVCLLVLMAVVAATASANASLADVPEISGGSAELLAVLGVVSMALIVRSKKTKKLTMP
jgi:hypothetical protein